jgi:medium-chain acyl-[acyl-carrier-protein] hydrolase
LFCLPYAGAGAISFSLWADELPADVCAAVEVWSLEPPGRDMGRRQQLQTQVEAVVDRLQPLVEAYSEKPFALFGHSMGALLSFELARKLRAAGVPAPAHVIVSGHRAPQLPDRHAPIHELPESRFVARLRVLGGTPEEVLDNTELMELYLPVLRADFAMCETYTYTPAPPLDCPITAFGGLDDARVNRDEISKWQEQTRGAFTMRMFRGGHFFFQQGAQTLVLQAVGQCLRHMMRRTPAEA